ncbi:alpha-glucosidase [Hydrogenibacillus sp. N12]|uniref:glycoside hydrolase family 13 protein n=1 Tax=Hydrogenibacillus sp. N12 TaxID=2866627 RepID=UPI00207C0BAA|nr:alpha-glucosidase [Hydrogenibacillus sp. N12]
MTMEGRARPERAWWKEAIVYQIYPRSFFDVSGDGVGDLAGIIAKLDYLQALGVDAVWLSPIYRSPGADNGYDVSDYREIDPQFGTMADFERLVREADARGIRLVLDLVVNHTSDEHPWFYASRQGIVPYRDFYIWRPGKNGGLPNRWRSVFGGPAWTYVPERDAYYLHLFSPKQPDLNWDLPAVRQEVYRLMRFWLEKGVAGFRMDVINAIGKPELDDEADAVGFERVINHPKAFRFLEEMYEAVLKGADLLTVGETPGVTPEHAWRYAALGRGPLGMIFPFEHMTVDVGATKWEPAPFDVVRWKRVLFRWQTKLEGRAWPALYLGNHDQPRPVSRFGDDGEYRVAAAKLLAALLLLQKGTPFVYQGEEIGMTNVRFPSIDDYRDIETLNFYREGRERGVAEERLMAAIHRMSRDNARTPMQWSAGKNAGFTSGTPWIRVNPNYREINVEAAWADPDSVLHFYRALIALRKRVPALVYGRLVPLCPDDPAVIAFLREDEAGPWLVALNLSPAPTTWALPRPIAGRPMVRVLDNRHRPPAYWDPATPIPAAWGDKEAAAFAGVGGGEAAGGPETGAPGERPSERGGHGVGPSTFAGEGRRDAPVGAAGPDGKQTAADVRRGSWEVERPEAFRLGPFEARVYRMAPSGHRRRRPGEGDG